MRSKLQDFKSRLQQTHGLYQNDYDSYCQNLLNQLERNSNYYSVVNSEDNVFHLSSIEALDHIKNGWEKLKDLDICKKVNPI